MKRHTTIFNGSEITYDDVYDFGEYQAGRSVLRLHTAVYDDFFTREAYHGYQRFVNHFETDLCRFWLCVLWRKKIKRVATESTFECLFKHYQDFYVQITIDRSIEVFEQFYEAIKAYLINIEYYELIPELDNKARLFKELLKNIRKQYEPKGLPKRLPDGVVKR